ncbi:MAG: hypothetical protein KJ042_16930, partial [Deltaproteobacteria bacterium]|nr:hypothetical protein [Deltaproteobacteria bacterium]
MGATEKPRRELPKPKRRGKANAVARDRNAANGYDLILADVVALLESARHASARAVNAVMTATYWEIGRRIVEFEQGGEKRAEYGKSLLVSLSRDLTEQFGRGFGYVNLTQMRKFFVLWPREGNLQTPSEFFETGIRNESAPIRRTLPGSSAIDRRAAAKSATTSRKSAIRDVANTFPLPWSHYVRLLSVESPDARTFYETEALRSGWTVRQLDRQIASLFYERTLMSRNKSAMLAKGARPKPGDAVSPEEEIKDPLILEFLGLRDEYSESELEGALIGQLER